MIWLSVNVSTFLCADPLIRTEPMLWLNEGHILIIQMLYPHNRLNMILTAFKWIDDLKVLHYYPQPYCYSINYDWMLSSMAASCGCLWIFIRGNLMNKYFWPSGTPNCQIQPTGWKSTGPMEGLPPRQCWTVNHRIWRKTCMKQPFWPWTTVRIEGGSWKV